MNNWRSYTSPLTQLVDHNVDAESPMPPPQPEPPARNGDEDSFYGRPLEQGLSSPFGRGDRSFFSGDGGSNKEEEAGSAAFEGFGALHDDADDLYRPQEYRQERYRPQQQEYRHHHHQQEYHRQQQENSPQQAGYRQQQFHNDYRQQQFHNDYRQQEQYKQPVYRQQLEQQYKQPDYRQQLEQYKQQEKGLRQGHHHRPHSYRLGFRDPAYNNKQEERRDQVQKDPLQDYSPPEQPVQQQQQHHYRQQQEDPLYRQQQQQMRDFQQRHRGFAGNEEEELFPGLSKRRMEEEGVDDSSIGLMLHGGGGAGAVFPHSEFFDS